jgi:lysozyme family protein
VKQNFEKALALTLRYEGEYSDHPADPGGATMRGVTQKVYDAFRAGAGRPYRAVKKIEESELRAIYRTQYWDLIQGDKLPAGVDAAVFDYAVNSGATRASRALQTAVGQRVDGNIGNATLVAVMDLGEIGTIEALCDERMIFLRRLKTFSTFGKGWTRRVAAVRRACLAMVELDQEMVGAAEMDYELAGGAGDDDLGAAPADPRQIGVMTTKTGQGTAIGTVGVLGTMASEAADKFEPLASFSPIMMTVFGGLLVVGFGLTAYGVVKAIREERAA